MLDKLLNIFQVWIPSIFFNFHYLPFKQAVKLPILLKKPHFRKLGGKVIIESDNIRRGMIRLGFNRVNIYPDNGISWLNEGIIIFKGKVSIGSDSYIVVRHNGQIIFGDDFSCSAAIKLVSCIGIEFKEGAHFGWDCLVMDTNFHPLYDTENKRFKKAYGRITIGANNWFSTQCMIMHSVETPERCIFGARSIVTRGGHYESYCLHGGSPIHVLSRNVMRIYGEDQITEYK